MLSEGLRVFQPVALGLILSLKIIFFFWLVLVEKWQIVVLIVYIAKRELLDKLQSLGIHCDVIVRWIFDEDGPIRYPLIFSKLAIQLSNAVQSFDRLRGTAVD